MASELAERLARLAAFQNEVNKTTRQVPALITPEVLADIAAEADAAHFKHGGDSMLYGGDDRKFRILAEEVGEVAKELNDAEIEHREPDPGKLYRELTQVAATAATWMQRIKDDG